MKRAGRLELPTLEAREDREVVRARAGRRVRLIGSILWVILAVVTARGVWLCVEPDPRIVKRGSIQRYDQDVIRGRRGDILDRSGRRLATTVETPSVIVDPFLLRGDTDEQTRANIDHLSREVATILDLSPAYVAKRMARDSRYARIKARVHPERALAIEALGHPALWIKSDTQRYYPEQSLGSQVLGFVNSKGEGREGLEGQLNSRLSGSTVVVQRRRDRHGRDVDHPLGIDPQTHAGYTVHTTLDRSIQRLTERALEGVVERHEPLSATAIVVQVDTGDILAMANVPDFNPNAIGPDAAPRKNHAVQDAIEPGSVFKPFTVAIALEEGLVSEHSLIDCEGGAWRVKRTRIHDDHPHGVITVSEVIKYSSNIGAAKLALGVGAPTFLSSLKRFGFASRTGVELPGERRGFLRDPDRIRPIELATTAYGQGTTSTPLQLAMAIATLANDGVRMRPRLVTRIEDAHGVPEQIHLPEVVERVVSPETARAVARMMVTVTEPGGTATRARIPGYLVAGKTGTAEKVKDGAYTSARIGSFVGFVPADDPVLAIVVVVDEPSKGSRYGGIVAAPAFAEIAAGALRELGVPPNPELLEPMDEEAPAVAEAEQEPLRLTWVGDAWRMPDFSGRPLRDVLASVQTSGLRLQIEGGGHAVTQRPAVGETLTPGDTLTLVFQ